VSAPEVNDQCRCVWNGSRCPNKVTQEDGLCDWCGTRRAEDMADNQKWDERSQTLGGGELHDSFDPSVRPPACWYPDSGRILAALRTTKEGK